MDEGLGPILPMDLDEGLHGVALAFDPGLPAVELAGALGPLQVDLVAGDDGRAGGTRLRRRRRRESRA